MQIHSARKPAARARDAKYRLDTLSGAVSDGRHPLSMYARPPQGEVTLEEFENFAYDRLEGTLRDECPLVVFLSPRWESVPGLRSC